LPKQSAEEEIMVKQQTRSGKEKGGAVLAAIFCVAVALGLWAGLGRSSGTSGHDAHSVAGDWQDKSSDTVGSFYCNTKALSKEDWAHKNQISGKMRSARVEIKELADGYAFRYRPGGVSLVELADWVESEAKCCPFFDMAISVEHEGGPEWLMLRGKDGVKQFIRSEFKLTEK
jgi:hypothetical protein